MKSVKGVIVSGLGEGSYFMSMDHYRKEIKKRLGFEAYPGTLNVKINGNRDELLKEAKPIKISGFASENKTFGGASCYKAKITQIRSKIINSRICGIENCRTKVRGIKPRQFSIKNINGAVIIPDINKNPENIIEFIAPVNIKSALNLKNNDEIEIEFL